MSTKVNPSQSNFRNTPIPDSGARIPQEMKESDRHEKFKLFECLQALIKGRLPTNAQIDQFLAMAQTSAAMDARAHMLSRDGQSLWRDFQELMKTTRGIVYEKNEQELLQNFIYHCTQATETVPSNAQVPNLNGMGVSTETAKKEGQETLECLKKVARLITTNSEFRSVLQELFNLAQEVFSDGADQVAQGAQNLGNKLSGQANEFSQYVSENSATGGSRVQQGIQQASAAVQETALNAKQDPMATAQMSGEEMRQQGRGALDSVKGYAKNMKEQMTKGGEGMKTQAQEQAKMRGEEMRQYGETKMPKERRNQIAERLKKVVREIQADEEYQSVVDAIMQLVGTWRERVKHSGAGTAQSVGSEANRALQDPNVEAAIIEFKVILQRWAQGYGLDRLIALIQNMWYRTIQDPDLSQYVDMVSHFFAKAIRDPNYVTSASSTVNDDMTMLLDHGQALLNVKYKPETDAILEEGKTFVNKLNTDPRSQEVTRNFQKFAKDLFYDKEGKLSFKPHLFDDFRYVLLPSLLESFQFIPIPRIEYSDMKVDLMFDNMILTSTDLLPRLFEVHMNNMLRMVPRGNTANTRNRGSPLDANKHEFDITIQGLEASVRNVDYFVRTKEGFRFKDRGIADVLIHKRGLDIVIKGHKTVIENDQENYPPSLITVDDVKVKIHSLSIKMRKSQHSILYTLAQPFIRTVVKNAIAHALETQVKEALTSGDKTIARSVRDARIRSGKNTFGALMDTATSFVSNKVHPDEKTKAKNERKRNQGQYNRTSRVIFDEDGLCVLDPIKHMELKVGQPLAEDKNEMARMGVRAPWASTAFDVKDSHGGLHNEREMLPGMRRTQGTLAM